MRVRIEIGDRMVEVDAGTREEALKAFKFAARGQFGVTVAEPIRWRTALIGAYRQLLDDCGVERASKINAIKALRNVTSLGLAEAKAAIELGVYQPLSRDEAILVRDALAPYVTFVEAS